MLNHSFGFVGGGRITRILLSGWNRGSLMPTRIVVSDSDGQAVSRLRLLVDRVEIASSDNRDAAVQDIVFLAIHPPAMKEVLEEIADSLQPHAVVVSLAPKCTLTKLLAMLKGFNRLARMLPNAASFVGAGFNPIAFADALSADDRAELANLFRPLGELREVAEEKLEAYAILTAMGPTYFWPQFYELQALAEKFGLSPKDAAEGLRAMVDGALATMYESGLSPKEVQDLIPVKPLAEAEEAIRQAYRTRLAAVMEKIRPQ